MKKQHSNNTSLIIVSIIAIVNALGYGIIIPLLYSYGARFGMGAVATGVLFASFSLAQFIATPIIGRMSDKYGRKPLLAYSVFGSAISFFLFAFARSAPFLFMARIMDGISGGNISVAQAVISDTTEPKDRAKWFGILGASFGVGFLVGPAIGGVLSHVALNLPFLVAGAISLMATALVVFVLPETLAKGSREKSSKPLIDFPALFHALLEPYVGRVLTISFITSLAFAVFVLGFQSFTNDVLHLSPTNIALLFTLFGVIGLIMQGFAVGKLVKKFGDVPMMIAGLAILVVGMIGMGAVTSLVPFVFFSCVFAVGNAFPGAVVSTLLSKHTKKEDQGGILGINQSYVSLGSIAGPLVGGFLTSKAASFPFYGAAIVTFIALILSFLLHAQKGKHVIDL